MGANEQPNRVKSGSDSGELHATPRVNHARPGVSQLFVSGPVFLFSALAWAYLTWILWPEWFIHLRLLYAYPSFTGLQLFLATAAWGLFGTLAVTIYARMGRNVN